MRIRRRNRSGRSPSVMNIAAICHQEDNEDTSDTCTDDDFSKKSDPDSAGCALDMIHPAFEGSSILPHCEPVKSTSLFVCRDWAFLDSSVSSGTGLRRRHEVTTNWSENGMERSVWSSVRTVNIPVETASCYECNTELSIDDSLDDNSYYIHTDIHPSACLSGTESESAHPTIVTAEVNYNQSPLRCDITTPYSEDKEKTGQLHGAASHKEVNLCRSASIAAIESNALEKATSFTAFRLSYLIVHTAIMLADGLQGTHLYVLYEGYGYSVASLYCLGFVSGALTSPFIGPVVDKIGRKKAALLYCLLEMIINLIEQYPLLLGLVASRVVGGVTTNLLFSVFESWLVTEHRKRGYSEQKLGTILRDSAIASNLAAIASGCLAHFLASKFGSIGPFQGAVMCTCFAFLLVKCMWSENYGSTSKTEIETFHSHMARAFNTIVQDSKVSRIGLIQGLTEGSLQTFVFLWSPALRSFAANSTSSLGLDEQGEPAYGLVFGAFMACGVCGGLAEPFFRNLTSWVVSLKHFKRTAVTVNGQNDVGPDNVEILSALCYFLCAGLLCTPLLVSEKNPFAFSITLTAFLFYEFLVGMYMPCEGVMRSIYMPTSSTCSLMTMLRVIVNVAVAVGVISTNYVSFATAFGAIATMMLVAAGLQLSLAIDCGQFHGAAKQLKLRSNTEGSEKSW